MANVASHHVLGFVVKLALLAYFLFAFVFLFLRYAILPNIEYYKGDIEQQASRALGSQVAITRIYASWHGLRPNLFLGDVILRDGAGRQVLSLPSVSATLSWWSVLAASPRFDSLEIIRPDLDIRRNAKGAISVAGIVLDPKGGDSRGPDWLFNQERILVRDGKVRWTDELRAAPELALSNLNIVLLNSWNRHRFALQAVPSGSLSGPIDVRADFTHPRFASPVSDVRQWSGELFADLRDTDLAGWKAYLDYPFEVTRGRGSLRAWLSLDRAKLSGFTADLALQDVSARLGKTLPPLELARVAGRMSAAETFPDGANKGLPAFGANGHTVRLTGFSLLTRDGLALAPTTIEEAYIPASGAEPDKFHVSARQLDLEVLAKLAARLPLGAHQRQLLADFAPRGSLSDFSANWNGKYPAISAYRVKGRLSGLAVRPQRARLAQAKTATSPAVAAVPAIPGVENLSGAIDASEKGGSIAVDSQRLVLQLPSWFAEPSMPFDELRMQARWHFAADNQLMLDLDKLSFTQGNLKGSLSGRHQMPLVAQPGKPAGVVDLSGTLTGFDVKQLGRFLPLQTPVNLREWLLGAIQEGVLRDATVRLRGDLAQFPFRDSTRGEFKIAGRIENGRLNYAPANLAADGKSPQWPHAEQINGTILFERARMEIVAQTARTAGVALNAVTASVADLYAPDRILEIDGAAGGALQDFLRYVEASPVGGWIGHFTEPTRGSGNAKLALKLSLPLQRMKEAKVQGALQLINNDVVLFPELPPLQSAIGKVEFHERGFNLAGVGASFLGGPLALTGGSLAPGAGIVVRMAGSLSADGIRRNYPAAAMAPVTSALTGSARYSGAVTVKDGLAQVTLDSTLAGLGLAFPAPLNKAAGDALPLHFTLTGLAPAAGAAPEAGVGRDDIRLTLGAGISARYLRQRQRVGQAMGPWKVQSGGIGVNVPAPEPDDGVMINASMKSLNVDQWVTLAKRIANAPPEAAAVAAPDGSGVSLAQYVVPNVIAARANELFIGERKLENVVVGASHQGQTWQASIDSRQIDGHVMWDEGAPGQALGKVTARLASLIIPESAAADVKDLLESGKSPAASIPALDIVAERFELFNKQLGRLELLASNATGASGREWRINRLSLVNPDGVLKSTGKWVTREGVSTTSLNFVLDIEDAGKLLDRFGFPDTLRRGKGRMSGDIAWNGLPYTLDTPSLSGKLDLKLAAGQFLKKDPGAAKLLGVLSLQMLPRILKLDFHDVISEGLAFDGITAGATITRGVVRTDNLRMHGVAATVLMDGTADIGKESTDLHVVVIPEFNLGTGPLVYALAVNPVVGLGSFLAQLFLRAPMMRALTYEMQVTGPWKAPIVTKLTGPRNRPRPVAIPALPAIAPPHQDNQP